MKKKSNNKIHDKLVVGCVQFGQRYGIYNKKYVSKNEINKIFKHLSKKKIIYLDTADNYGDANKIIKENILKKKNNFRIIYKISKDKDIFEKKLQKIISSIGKKPYAILCHNFKDYRNKKFRNNLFSFKSLGIKKIGVSLYKIEELRTILNYKKKPDIIQIPLNIIDTRFLNENLIKLIKKYKIEFHARSIFLQGLYFYSYKKILNLFPKEKKILNKIKKLLLKDKLSLSHASLKFVNSISQIKRIVIGVKSLDELKTNLKIMREKSVLKEHEAISRLNYKNNDFLLPYKWKWN